MFSVGDTVAPTIEGAGGVRYVLPDLDVARAGERRWVEVKAKTEASYTHLTSRFEHGIAATHYDDYRAIEEITGTPVYLVIIEASTGDVLSARLSELESVKRLYYGSKMDRGMVFYPRDAFTLIGNVKGAA